MSSLRFVAAVLLCVALGACGGGCGKRKPADAPSEQYRANVEEAKRLLAAAGYPEGKGFPQLEILYNTNEAHKKIAAAVQEMWRQNLGVDIGLRNVEWKVYLDMTKAVDYQIARRGWIADYTDPNTFLSIFTSDSGNNDMKYADPVFDEFIAEARRTVDPKKRLEVLQKAEARFMDEMPILPIYFYATQCMWRSNLHGVHDNLMNIHPLKEIAHEDGSKLFVMNTGGEPQTLDPNRQRGVPEHRINLALFEGLTTYTPKTMEPAPAAAESWTKSPDGLTWTFKIREAKWTNGRAVTAHDFVYGWLRALDPALGAPYAHIIYDYLKNAKAYYDGATADGAIEGFGSLAADRRLESARGLVGTAQARHSAALAKAAETEPVAQIKALLKKAAESAAARPDVARDAVGVKATDDRTLVVTLENPCHYFLFLAAFPAYNPIPREAVEEHGDRWIQPANIVTNGPFRMTEWVANSHILVERNAGYWDAGKVRQQKIKFLPIDNVKTAFDMFQNDQCDFVDTVPTEFAAQLLKGDPNFHSSPYLGAYFYMCNVTVKPLDDKRVRRALALAINRDAIVKSILGGRQQPAYNVVPPHFPGYEGQLFNAEKSAE